MLYLRLLLPAADRPVHGRVTPERPDEVELLDERRSASLRATDGELFADLHPSGQRLPFTPETCDAWQGGDPTAPRLLAPLVPGKIIGVGSNYVEHTREMGKPLPEEPVLFFKPTTALLDPGGAIIRPEGFTRVDYEGELAVVIGRRLHRAAPEDVPAALFGYCALNDVSARELQRKDGQFTRAKGFDTFCPLGPALQTDIEQALDPARFTLRTFLNGKLVQDAAQDRFLFTVPELVACASQVMTLLPGDVITTGTPAGVGNLSPGDVVSIEIGGLPPLRSRVVAGPAPRPVRRSV